MTDLSPGNFILNNYQQALDYTRKNTPRYEQLLVKLNILPADCERYLEEERAYLHLPKKEPAIIERISKYMEVLQNLKKARNDYEDARSNWERINVSNASVQTKRGARTKYEITHEKWWLLDERAGILEEELEIDIRWAEDSAEYRSAVQILKEREYRSALDNLEHLVVQRLFELSKLGVYGLGACFSVTS